MRLAIFGSEFASLWHDDIYFTIAEKLNEAWLSELFFVTIPGNSDSFFSHRVLHYFVRLLLIQSKRRFFMYAKLYAIFPCYNCLFNINWVDFFDRKRLFSLINELPTVFEVVTERKPIKDKPSVDSGSKSRGSTKVRKMELKLFLISWFSSIIEFVILKLGSISLWLYLRLCLLKW